MLGGLLLVEGLLFIRLLRDNGGGSVVGGIPFHLCVIAASAVCVLPGVVLLPGYSHALAFVAERLSLGVAICVCALLGTVELRKVESAALLTVAAVFFGFLYRDARALNAFEDGCRPPFRRCRPAGG